MISEVSVSGVQPFAPEGVLAAGLQRAVGAPCEGRARLRAGVVAGD